MVAPDYRSTLEYLRPLRLRVSGLALALIGSIGLQLAAPLVLRRFIDVALGEAVATSLVTRAVRADGDAGMLGHILDYATAFKQREMGVMLVSDLHRATGAKLFAVPQFANWAEQIGDILVS